MCIKNIFHIAGNMENSYNMHIFIYYNPLAELNQRIFYPPNGLSFPLQAYRGPVSAPVFPDNQGEQSFHAFRARLQEQGLCSFPFLGYKGLDTCSRHWQAVSPCTRPDSGSLPAKCREHLQHRAQAAHAATGA